MCTFTCHGYHARSLYENYSNMKADLLTNNIDIFTNIVAQLGQSYKKGVNGAYLLKAVNFATENHAICYAFVCFLPYLKGAKKTKWGITTFRKKKKKYRKVGVETIHFDSTYAQCQLKAASYRMIFTLSRPLDICQ